MLVRMDHRYAHLQSAGGAVFHIFYRHRIDPEDMAGNGLKVLPEFHGVLHALPVDDT